MGPGVRAPDPRLCRGAVTHHRGHRRRDRAERGRGGAHAAHDGSGTPSRRTDQSADRFGAAAAGVDVRTESNGTSRTAPSGRRTSRLPGATPGRDPDEVDPGLKDTWGNGTA